VIVADASAVLEALLNTPAGDAIADILLDPAETVAAPHLLDLEVLQVLRRYTLTGSIDTERGQQAIEDYLAMPILRYPHEPLVSRVWDLRDNLTAYDATYIALAEALDAPLLTRDARLAAAPAHGARIELV
jgi:predicted nucleic acid-binding protein